MKAKTKTHKLTAWLLTIIMLMTLVQGFAIPASAQGELQSFSGGSGTQADPYLISTKEDLFALSDAIYADESGTLDVADDCGLGGYHGYYFKQTADIDLSGVAWKPFNFCGVYDGNGYEIQNLSASEQRFDSTDAETGSVTSNEYETAFFGQLVHAVIKNLTFTDCSATIAAELDPSPGRDIYVGIVATTAIAARFENIKVVNCTVEQNAEEDNFGYAGGMVGYADICNFTDCKVEGGSITIGGSAGNSGNAGGIVGGIGDMYDEYKDFFNMSVGAGRPFGIFNCSATADISVNNGVNGYAGGIAGWTVNDYLVHTIKDCYVEADITAGSATGICGYSSSSDLVKNCFANIGTLTGAIKKYAIGTDGTFTDCAFRIEDATDVLGTDNTSYSETEYTDGTVLGVLNGERTGSEVAWVQGNSYPVLKTAYAVTISDEITNGTVTADITKAAMGETVTLTVTPATDYTIATITYNDGEDHTITPTAGVYSFTMPASDVTVYAQFKELLPGEILIHGVDIVNGDNDNTIELESGTAVYNPAKQKLTLTNASITEPSSTSRRAGIYINDFTSPVTIELVGENNITLTNTAYDNNGIWNDSDADLTIEGTGSLDVTQYNDYSPYGIWNRNSNLTIKNCAVAFRLEDGSATNGFLVDCAENITVDGATVSAEGFLQGLFAEGDVSVKNSANIDITAIENAIYSDTNISIEGASTVNVDTIDTAGICSWGDINITNSDVTANSEYDNGIYCYGHITISGGEVTVNSDEFDALQSFGGIEVKNNATVTAESANGAGIYTGETLDVLSGTVTATGTTKAIVARRISDNASDNQPTESADAITLGSNMAEESGATIKTEDWVYGPVWDPWEWDDVDRWMSRSYFVDSTNTPVTTAKIITKAPQTTTGGGGGLTRYTIKFDSNGGSKVADARVYRNDAIDEPTAPTRDGYTFDGWYTDEELTSAYDFASEVTKGFTLYAKWTENDVQIPDDKPTQPDTPSTECDGTDDCPSLKFSDLDVNAWYHLDTDYVIENGIFNGITDTTFEPNSNLTRAMLVTVLYRIEGEAEVTGETTFEDVADDAYYADAVIWAQQNGIVEGHSETEFAPEENITREQLATIMHRYAQFKGYDVSVGENTNILSYDDFDSISEYAITAIQYAVGSGMINGKTDTTINPQDNATRAECAAILHRFIEANK